MAIYRGSGGATDTTDQATIDEVTEQAGAAAASATAAASSASSASTSASNAAISESNASTSASEASTSASQASYSKDFAAASASAARTSFIDALIAKDAAVHSESITLGYKNNAQGFRDEAEIYMREAQIYRDAAFNYKETSEDLYVGTYNASVAASNSASSASTSATSAAASASAAATTAEESEAALQAIADSVKSFYLGAEASAPTLDDNGDALTAGDWYFNTTDNQTYIYNGSSWSAVSPELIGDTTPELGGILSMNNHGIYGYGTIEAWGTSTTQDEAVTSISMIDKASGSGDEGKIVFEAIGRPGSTFNEEYPDLYIKQYVSGTTDALRPRIKLQGSTGYINFYDANGNSTFEYDNEGDIETTRIVRSHVGFWTDQEGDNSTNVGFLSAVNNEVQVGSSSGSKPLTFMVGNLEKARLTSDGYLGIGTDSPSSLLTLGGDTASDGDNSSSLTFLNSVSGVVTDEAAAKIAVNSDSTGRRKYNLDFYTGQLGSSTKQMTLDFSGNLLVGKATTGLTDAGFLAYASGTTNITRDNSTPLNLNRKTSDGKLVEFWKDGSTVGSIGSASGDRITIGTDNVLLGFSPVADSVYPATTTGTINLGTESARFKDLYLSGGLKGDTLTFSSNAGSERMRITSSGNVGIGTDSPSYPLHVDTTGTTIASFNGPSAYVLLQNKATGVFNFNVGGTSDSFAFETQGTERMRLDSSGNLLVGKTASSLLTVGAELTSTGQVYATVSSAPTARFNRTTSDGEIVDFRKDGTTVGSIGSRNGTSMTLSSSGSVNMYDTSASAGGIAVSSNIVYPINNTGATTDDLMTLGSSSVRFKDLYLSGGVVFGTASGDVTSKTLDDYEEGTWTPTVAGDATGVINVSGASRYVKIGNVVHVQCQFQVTTTFTANEIGGLPFQPVIGSSISNQYGLSPVCSNISGSFIMSRINDTSTRVQFVQTDNTTNHAPSTTGSVYRLCFTYETTQ